MGRYDDIAKTHSVLLANLAPVSQLEFDKMRTMYVGTPDDYLDFLREIGAGMVGNNSFMLYSGLVAPKNIYGPEAGKELRDVVLFGDDLQGYCVGFAPGFNSVVEVDPNDWTWETETDTFENFIRGLLARLVGASGDTTL